MKAQVGKAELVVTRRGREVVEYGVEDDFVSR
jgi:hypothetical protein